MTKSIEIDSQPPLLPAEDEELAVYVEYAAELDSFEATFHDAVMSIFVKKQGHLAHLKGQALLRAKASSKVDVGWDAIFAAFGVKRSTGFVHIDIAESFPEEESKGQGVNELREEAQRRRAAAGGGVRGGSQETLSDADDDSSKDMYSIKKARGDLEEAKKRLKRFKQDIAKTSDAINNPQSTPVDLSSFDSDFDELKRLLASADEARCQALSDSTKSFTELLLVGSAVQISESEEEEAN